MEQLLNIFKNINVEQLVFGMIVLIICLVVSRLLIRLFDRILHRSRHIDASLHSVMKTTLRIVLYFISIIFSAGVMGIPVTSFLALFSVVGLAVSLAVQGVLSNLAGGVIILASKPFTLGDYIETDAVAGTVNEIGFLHTRMVSPDGKMIFVPNNLLYNSKLINYTSSGTRRIDVTLYMSYECEPDRVRAAAMEAISTLPGALSEPAPLVHVERYEKNAVKYTVRVWSSSQDYLTVLYGANEALYAAMRRHELKIAHPYVNVHMQ